MLYFFFVAPTILTEVADTDPIMQQNVFGPVLPVFTVNTVDKAINFIIKQEKPLCVYAYSNNSKVYPKSHSSSPQNIRKNNNNKALYTTLFLVLIA